MENPEKSDLAAGIPAKPIPDGGMIQGRVHEEDVILTRRGEEFFAVGAKCTHYGGPLIKGLVAGDELRCPLHHACFNLRTGEALRAPALDPIPCWRVEVINGTVFVREKLTEPISKQAPATQTSQKTPASVVIVGGGAAGLAAADMLRRKGYDGTVTMISADDSAPYDRPNLSKEFLSGDAPEEWMPLRQPDFYTSRQIQLVLNRRAVSIDIGRKQVRLEGGETRDCDALLLATGADPVKISVPGASDSQLHYLRSFADSRALVEKAQSAKQVVIVGASFIGLEVAASLRERNIAVHIVAPGRVPLEHVFGHEIGSFIRCLHESHGVTFHMGETVARVDGRQVTLSGGSKLDADFLALGVGVRPAVGLAEQAGLRVDRGVVVNEYLETSAPGIFAAGDIARWPDPHSGQMIRIEHWVVAGRQGQVAARNILGHRERFNAVPFFWTRQFKVSVKYIGHAETWDEVAIDGNLENKDCAATFKLGGRTLAVATIGRDLQNLQVEAAMEASLLQSPSSPLLRAG
jgi:NADPH-dependent 2,4-dienoyl-CoA reductase/sulfur reductase-like enzyme/nitrite reductase/ring-hydroxylating ferredoxin subunit